MTDLPENKHALQILAAALSFAKMNSAAKTPKKVYRCLKYLKFLKDSCSSTIEMI